jgi:hypothetical protein
MESLGADVVLEASVTSMKLFNLRLLVVGIEILGAGF